MAQFCHDTTLPFEYRPPIFQWKDYKFGSNISLQPFPSLLRRQKVSCGESAAEAAAAAAVVGGEITNSSSV